MKAKIELLDGLFIDVFREEVRRVQVVKDLDTWYKLLDCPGVECACLAESPEGALDLWYDEEFNFREPRLPAFQLDQFEVGRLKDDNHSTGTLWYWLAIRKARA